jgi:probable F420-dependent oxidoreductase
MTGFAQRAEQLGYRSLWTFQRLLVPPGSQLGPVYQSVLDPMVSLGYLAAATSSVRLGVAVVNHPFVSPLLLAKQAATVDVLSGGRLDLGLGSGWMPEEFTGSGASMARRGARADEYVAALRALWSGADGYAGTFYTIPPGRQQPAPVQRPGPPVILGGMRPPALSRAGRIGDGWVTASATDLTIIADLVAVVQDAARAAGRDPVRIIVRGVVRPGSPVISDKTGQRLPLSGSYEQIRADTQWLGTSGVSEVFYDVNFDPAVGNPAVDEGRALDRAYQVLEALAPGAQA